MLTRRELSAALAGGVLAVLASCAGLPVGSPGTGSTLTVIAYNIQACTGWPEKRARAKAAVAEKKMAALVAAELAKYGPDIINFSESPAEATAVEIARLLGMNHVRLASALSWPGTVLSRYPIIESANVPLPTTRPKDLFTRHWGRVEVKLPGGETIIVHSAHLYPFADPTRRLQEVAALLPVLKGDLATGQSVILMGDLNCEPSSEEIGRLTEAGLVDTFGKVGSGSGFTRDADAPRTRIDYVFAGGPLAGRIVEARPLFEGAFKLELTDPEAFALSDHVPELARFRWSVASRLTG